jgi:hypothetical protein
MTEPYPWYGLTEGEALEQGDFLLRCPSYQTVSNGEVGVETVNVVLLSHSCDLANDKLDVVQVCPYWPLEAMAAQQEYLRSRKGREDLRRGNLPGYHLLNRPTLAGLENDFLVVDFRSLFGVPLGTIKHLATGQRPRARLLPPYREHLAQAFARFFMRVGLPVDVPPF